MNGTGRSRRNGGLARDDADKRPIDPGDEDRARPSSYPIPPEDLVVEPGAQGQWTVGRAGAGRPIEEFELAMEAFAFACAIARNVGGSVTVIGPDSTFTTHYPTASQAPPPQDKRAPRG
jgi:hypothetical protein